jgi:hypothetical protein
MLAPPAPGAVAQTSMRMSLHSSNGYTLQINATSGRPITLEATKRVGRGFLYTTYSVEGRVSAKGFSANFGRVGHVDVALPSSMEVPARDCNGKRAIHRTGSFGGTIQFRGEQGFSAVSATGARGSLRRDCTPRRQPRAAHVAETSAGASPRYFLTHFVAASKGPRQSVVVDSSTLGMLLPDGQLRDPHTLVLAELEEARGRVSIERSTIVTSSPIAASPFETTPVTATLAPQSPFSGGGTYREEAGAPTSWTGDLSVDLPGAKSTPLTGPGFTAILCRGEFDPALGACQDKAAQLLSTAD